MSEDSSECENGLSQISNQIEEAIKINFSPQYPFSNINKEEDDQSEILYKKLYFIKSHSENQNSTRYQTNLDISVIKIVPIYIQNKRGGSPLFEAHVDKDFRLNNERKRIGRNCFNNFLKNLIENMITICGINLHLKKFPSEFIFYIINKSNKFVLEITLEKLLGDESLYKGRDPKNYYPNHQEVINELKKVENKKALKKAGKDKFLGMKFKDLFNKYYLTSTEFKQKKDELIEKKGIDEAKNFEQFSKSFIEDYQN